MKSIKLFLLFVGVTILVLLVAQTFFAKDNTPMNVQYVGDNMVIDLHYEQLSDRFGIKRFVVSKSFNPTVLESIFIYYINFLNGKPTEGNKETARQEHEIRISVNYSNAMKSQYLLEKTQPKSGKLKLVPYLVHKTDAVQIYEYLYSNSKRTFYRFEIKDATVLVDDPGSWSGDYNVYRKFADNLELHYSIRKSLIKPFSIEKLREVLVQVDEAVIDSIKSFQYRTIRNGE